MQENLFPVIKDGKSGFINGKGEVIIDFEFEGASSFSEGLARIFLGSKVGFIDSTGSIKIPPKFDSALSFSEGRAVVTIGDKQGFIDTSGKLVISPRFYSCNKFENGIALVLEEITSKACFIDEKGEIKLQGKDFLVSKFKEELINCSENGK